MRAVLEFNLPDDDADYKMAVHADKMYSSLLNIDNILRNYRKYKEDPKIDDLMDEIHNELVDCRLYEIE